MRACIEKMHARIQTMQSLIPRIELRVRYHARMPRGRWLDPDAERFGAIVKQLREQRGWTRQKLAQRAGITPTYMGILEYGGNVPTLPTILELMEVLGADIGDVMRRLAAARVSALPVLPPEKPPAET
jgi:DNA-binding XRE family transcriptional regulator